GQRVEQAAPDLGDVAGGGLGEHGVALVGQLGDRGAAVGGVLGPAHPAHLLQPVHGVGQAARRRVDDPRELAHRQRAAGGLRQHRQGHVVGVRHPGVALELPVEGLHEQARRPQEGAPRLLFLGVEPRRFRHAPKPTRKIEASRLEISTKVGVRWGGKVEEPTVERTTIDDAGDDLKGDDMTRMPVLYLSHGAPPLADDPVWKDELARWSAELPKPKAVLMVSAHWEEAPLSIGATRPVPLVYDFWGFPERYYTVHYDAPGAPELASEVRKLIPGVHQDEERGLDHGAYVPLVEMYPDADVPVLQMSMPTLEPSRLFGIGRSLAPLRDQGVLIIGSGFTTHHLRELGHGPDATPPA